MGISYPGVYVNELPAGVKRIDGVQTSTAAFVGPGGAGPCDHPVHLHTLADFDRTFGHVANTDPMRLAVGLFFANGGRDAVVVRVGDEETGEPPAVRGLKTLDGVGRFDFLCLPGLYADTSPNSTPAIADVLEAASRFCARRGAILLIDPLPEWRTTEDMVSGPSSIGAAVTISTRSPLAAPSRQAWRVESHGGAPG